MPFTAREGALIACQERPFDMLVDLWVNRAYWGPLWPDRRPLWSNKGLYGPERLHLWRDRGPFVLARGFVEYARTTFMAQTWEL